MGSGFGLLGVSGGADFAEKNLFFSLVLCCELRANLDLFVFRDVRV